MKARRNKAFSIVTLDKNGRAAYAAELLALLMVPAAVFLVRHTMFGRFFYCWFHELTGRPCMFCGMTRSLEKCLTGDFQSAVTWHLFGPAFFLLFLILLLSRIAGVVSGHTVTLGNPHTKVARCALYIGLAALGAYWLLRLCEVPPFVFPEVPT